MNSKIIISCLTLCVGGLTWVYLTKTSKDRAFCLAQERAVAHAGGVAHNKTYSNSHEAIEGSLEKGFGYIELDFSWTKDEQLVCLHDWGKSFQKVFPKESPRPQTLKGFVHLREKSSLKPCTLDSLKELLSQHPRLFLITDVKNSNKKGLQLIAKELKGQLSQVIPQIHKRQSYPLVKKMGYNKIILTLYRFSGNNEEVVDLVKDLDLFAVTMSSKRAIEGLGNSLNALGMSTYVYTVNDTQEAKSLLTNYGITSIYTDYIMPRPLCES